MIDLDANALVALDALLATRSVTASARQLGISQSAMSHRLRQLREQIGDPLLIGGRTGLVPTARAEAIEQPLRRAVADLRAAVRQGEPFDAKTSTRRFVVATHDYGEFVAVRPLLRKLSVEAPHVSLVIEPIDSTMPAKLASGAFDLAVTAPTDLPPSLIQKPIAREEYAVALRRGHPALRGKTKRLSLQTYAELDHLLVAPRRLPGSIVDKALAERGLTRRIALRISNFVSAPFLVAESNLVTTLGIGLLRSAKPYVDLEILPPPLSLPTADVVMVWHERSQLDLGHGWFRTIIANSLPDSKDVQSSTERRAPLAKRRPRV